MRGDRVSDYDFQLPPELIAQRPPETRGASRLMVIDRSAGTIAHHSFADIASFIPPNDVLVRNTTRVIRARLLGTRDSGANAEILLLKPLSDTQYEAMVHPGGKLKPGRTVHIAPNFDVTIVAVTERGTRVVELHTELPIAEAIEQFGHIPLPPYIARPDTSSDADRYQTVYAHQAGSVAAPTAGLHFTSELFETLAARNVITADVTLHVGAGTFKPVETDDPTQHVMHEEWFHLPATTAQLLNEARARNSKIWAVGTTSVRTLESAVTPDGHFAEMSQDTRIFIYPPYQWKAVDHILTNFHLPRSTLLMLVAAAAGYELTMEAYRVAVEQGYRFFSYGDAMLII